VSRPRGDKPAKTVRVIDRAIDIVNCFDHTNDRLSLQRIVEQSGLQKATAFRIAGTLVRSGLLAQPESGGPYALGPLAPRIASLVIASHPLPGKVRSVLEDIRDLVKETIILAVRSNDSVVNLDKADGVHLIDATPAMGVRAPLHQEAAGLAILATWGESALLDYCRRTAGPAARAASLAATLPPLLATARSRGVVVLEPAVGRPHAQIAVPLPERAGELRAALWLAVPEHRLNATLLSRCELHLKAGADAVSARS
jgi:DNA-binding IclR family transcriptional regulator